MGTSATAGGCNGTVEAGMGAAGWGIGCDGTAVRLTPQDGQKAAPGGHSLPQLGQDMILICFSSCIKNLRY